MTLYLLSKLYSGSIHHTEHMTTEFIKLGNTILHVIKKIKYQHQKATKNIDF